MNWARPLVENFYKPAGPQMTWLFFRGGVACRLWRLICQHRNDQEVRAGRIFANNSSFGGLSARTSRDDYSAATAAPAIADELYTVAEMT